MSAIPITVLHVEDDDVDALAVERAFRNVTRAPSILRAKDGDEALEILRGADPTRRLTRPYVVLLDWNLPRMSGGEVLSRIRADRELRSSVVFVLTTSRSADDRRAAYDHNVAGYLVKSELGDELTERLALIADYGCLVELP